MYDIQIKKLMKKRGLWKMLSDSIKKLREEKGMSQVKFCEAAGISRATLYNLEEGVIDNPTLKQICSICRGLKVTPNDVIPKELYS